MSTVKTSPASRLNDSTSSSISSSVVPALEAALQTEADQRDAERRRLGVDDADPLAGLLAGPELRALPRSGELRGQVERVDPLEAGELLVHGCEVARGRLRRRRHDRRRAQARVEVGRRQLDVVAEALVAEEHVERHDAPVREACGASGKSAVESTTIAVFSAVSSTSAEEPNPSAVHFRHPGPVPGTELCQFCASAQSHRRGAGWNGPIAARYSAAMSRW